MKYGGVDMVINIKNRAILTIEQPLARREVITRTKIEVLSYSEAIQLMNENKLPSEVNDHYLYIQFEKLKVPNCVIENFYHMQVRGYVPIITNAELNMDFRRNPKELYALVKGGALVEINEASLLGKRGRSIRKFATKLCKRQLVHLVSSEAQILNEKNNLSKELNAYLQRKTSKEYVAYLISNARNIKAGKSFHRKEAKKIR